MNKKISKFIIVVVLAIFSYQCNSIYMDKFYSIEVKNNTNYFLNLYFADGITFYSDTLLPKQKGILPKVYPNKVFSQTSMIEWKYVFKKLPQDTLSVFIFHTDTLNKYFWEEVRDGHKILKRYDLSYKDLEKLQFQIPYPPSPEMAKMKMYPKYP